MLIRHLIKCGTRHVLALLIRLTALSILPCSAAAERAQVNPGNLSTQHRPPAVPSAYHVIELGSGGLTGYTRFNGSDQFAISIEDETGTSRALFYDRESVIDIGTLGGTHAYVSGLNERGEVAGHSFTAGNANMHAFVWSQQGGMRDLGSVNGSGSSTVGHVSPINNRGQVVGESTVPGRDPQAFLWSAAAGMRSLGGMPGNPSGFTIAHVINGAGLVAGHGNAADGGTHAFVWSSQDGLVDLGTLGGSLSVAAGLSNDGMVVGNSTISSGLNHMYVWTRSGGMRDLGAAGGVESYTSEKPMSPNGHVAGSIRFADGNSHAAVWTRATGLLDIGTLGGPMSFAGGVNNHAQVVGAADISLSEASSFIWTAQDGMRDLGKRLCQVPPGLVLGAGLAISDGGLIFSSTNKGYVLLKPTCG